MGSTERLRIEKELKTLLCESFTSRETETAYEFETSNPEINFYAMPSIARIFGPGVKIILQPTVDGGKKFVVEKIKCAQNITDSQNQSALR